MKGSFKEGSIVFRIQEIGDRRILISCCFSLLQKKTKMFAAGNSMTIKCLFHRDSRLEIIFNNFFPD